MPTPAKPSPTDPPPGADWLNLSQVLSPVPKPEGDPALPPLVGPKRPGPATPTPVPTPPPLSKKEAKDTPPPIWTEESIYVPPPPAAPKTEPVARPVEDILPPPSSTQISCDFRGQIGQYQVRSLIGEGGMGLVFKAHDIYLRRKVALKVMKPHVSNDDAAWKMFLNEAQATAALQNPRIATVYQVGEENGTMYLAMELLTGESLEARIQRGPVPLAEALVIVREAALGLAVAHETGFYHRDVKPANLWLTGPVNVNKSSDVLRKVRQDVTEN